MPPLRLKKIPLENDKDNFVDKLEIEIVNRLIMESVAYILILAMALAVLFFAIAFREPPRIEK